MKMLQTLILYRCSSTARLELRAALLQVLKNDEIRPKGLTGVFSSGVAKEISKIIISRPWPVPCLLGAGQTKAGEFSVTKKGNLQAGSLFLDQKLATLANLNMYDNR